MAVTGRILKSNHSDNYDFAVRKFWVDSQTGAESEYEKIYKTEKITTESLKGSGMSGFGLWAQKSMGANMTSDSVYQGHDVMITPYEYALYYQIERQTWEDDLQNVFGTRLAALLAESGRETKEAMLVSCLNGSNLTSSTGFSPYMAGGDGQALLSTAHPILSGGTAANCPASHADLSIATLQAARTRMAKTPNFRGIRSGMVPKLVVVPPDSEFLVQQILYSTSQLPYVADHTANPAAKGLDYFIWSRLTDTDMWLLLAAKGEPGKKGHSLTCIDRKSMTFTNDNDFLSGDKKYGGHQRFGAGYWDWRGVDGSTG